MPRTHGSVVRERLRWSSSGQDVSSLGLDSAAELFAPTAMLSTRLDRLAAERGRTRWRFPLPGTSDHLGNLTCRPGALGTGWLWLTVYRGGFGELLRARCTAPRSASL